MSSSFLTKHLPSIYSANLSTSVFSKAGFSWVTSHTVKKKTKKKLVVINYGNILYFHVFNGIDT